MKLLRWIGIGLVALVVLIGGAAAGVYFYRVQCAAGQASGRLIKIE